MSFESYSTNLGVKGMACFPKPNDHHSDFVPLPCLTGRKLRFSHRWGSLCHSPRSWDVTQSGPLGSPVPGVSQHWSLLTHYGLQPTKTQKFPTDGKLYLVLHQAGSGISARRSQGYYLLRRVTQPWLPGRAHHLQDADNEDTTPSQTCWLLFLWLMLLLPAPSHLQAPRPPGQGTQAVTFSPWAGNRRVL